MKLLRQLTVVSFCAACAGVAFSIEIPVTGAAGTSTGTGVKIAYVDLERIFQIYPETRAAKEDYNKQLLKKRELLAAKETELQDIKNRISVLEGTLKDVAPPPPAHSPASRGGSGTASDSTNYSSSASTSGVRVEGSTTTLNSTPPIPESERSVSAPPGAPPVDAQMQALQAARQELKEKQAEFEDSKKRAEEDLAGFQKQQSQIILGKIYQALRDLAAEEQVTLVVDKSSILYGTADIDLTEKLQQKVRGY